MQRKQRTSNHKMKEFDVLFTPDEDLSLNSRTYYGNNNGHFNEKNTIFPDELEYYNYFGASGGNSYMEFVSLKDWSKIPYVHVRF